MTVLTAALLLYGMGSLFSLGTGIALVTQDGADKVLGEHPIWKGLVMVILMCFLGWIGVGLVIGWKR